MSQELTCSRTIESPQTNLENIPCQGLKQHNGRVQRTQITFATTTDQLIRSGAARLLDCGIKAVYIYPTMDFLELDINLAQV